MHVITRPRLNGFAERFPETRTAFGKWYALAKATDFGAFAEPRAAFSRAGRVGKLTVFNVGGNIVGPVAAIHYHRGKVYIRAVVTHDDYGEGRRSERPGAGRAVRAARRARRR